MQRDTKCRRHKEKGAEAVQEEFEPESTRGYLPILKLIQVSEDHIQVPWSRHCFCLECKTNLYLAAL